MCRRRLRTEQEEAERLRTELAEAERQEAERLRTEQQKAEQMEAKQAGVAKAGLRRVMRRALSTSDNSSDAGVKPIVRERDVQERLQMCGTCQRPRRW
jgi:hypothetical protein